MNIFSALLILVSLQTTVLAGYTFRYRKSDLGLFFFAILFSISFFSFCYAFELNGAEIGSKLMWLRIGYIGLATISPFLLLFTLEYAGKGHYIKWPLTLSLFILVVIVLIANYTNDYHHLYYSSVSLKNVGPFSILVLERGPLYWIVIGYSFICNLVSIVILFTIVFSKRREFSRQALLILLALLPPWIINLTYIVEKSPMGVDLTAFGFLFTAVAMSISLFTYNLLGVIPVALTDVFRSMRDGAIILDSKKKIVDFNPAAALLYKNLRDKADNKAVNEILNFPEDIPAEGTEFESRHIVVRKSEEKRLFLRTRITPVSDRRGVKIGYMIMLYDITDFREYQIKLNELNDTKDKLFSIISHDLRGPLGTVLELIRLLREDLEEMDKSEIIKMLETIIVQTDSTYRLLDNLLFWSRNQISRIVCNSSAVDVNELVNEVFTELKYTSRRKELNMVNSIGEERYVFADRNMLKIILRNLVSNSVKYCNPRGTITVNCICAPEGTCMISVKDNGTGIREEKLSKLFELSSGTSSEGTFGEQGSSLGLIICKELTERQSGSISVESRPGEGSTFYVTLPGVNS